MKKLNIPLHIQIVLGLVLGTIFGVFFSVDKSMLEIKYLEKNKKIEKTIENWDEIYFFKNGEEVAKFSNSDQIAIIKYFKKHQKENLTLNVIKYDKFEIYENLKEINKISTLATQIKPIGDLFIRLLSFLAIPLVVASLIVGASSLGDIKKLGRIGTKTFILYLVTTAIAITIGLSTANLIKPGNRVEQETKTRLLSTFEDESAEKAVQTLDIDIVDFFLNIVPKNPINALASGNMLQIVFFAVIFGITLTYLDKRHSEPVIIFFEGVSQAMIKMVDIFMKIAPIGVFALIAATIADFGFEILQTLIWYCFAVVLALAIQTIFVYGAIVKIFSKLSLKKFFFGLRNAHAIAFSTSSSAATLPLTFECVENNLGVNKQISGFVLPLGATINMDGTALYQGVAAVFIAQVYGLDLSMTEQLTIIFTAVLASIGTAPVPGVGIIMLVLILNAVQIPAQGIALILGVDRILDMIRTITNVTGDASVAVAINGMEYKNEI